MKEMKIKIETLASYSVMSKAALILFLFSLLPLIYCSFFDYATGDDLWEGAAVYLVLQSDGSIKELISAVIHQFKMDYMGWQGNWSSSILWYFSPNVFGEKAYIVTPWIGLFSICAGYWYCLGHFNRKYLHLKREFYLILYSIITMISIHYMPYIRGGIFWYSGMINYTFPYGLVLAILVWIDKFLENGKKRYLTFLIIALSFLGGSGYLSIVLTAEAFFLVISINLFSKCSERRKRAALLMIPFLLLLIGFTISVLSPGNAVRGGEEYYFGWNKVFYTLTESIIQGVIAVPKTLWRAKVMILLFPIIVLGTWENLDLNSSKIQFKYPIPAVLFMFLISCSVYAPGIYANNELSGGVYDTIFYVFVLWYVFSIVYVTGSIKKWWDKREGEIPSWLQIDRNRLRAVAFSVVFLVYILGNPVFLNHSAFRTCVNYIASGQLKDFEYQMQERLAILHNPAIKDVVLPGMNDEQGPFMHMPLTEDPQNYTNVSTARYYGKNSVIAIPREEYYEKYGAPVVDE